MVRVTAEAASMLISEGGSGQWAQADNPSRKTLRDNLEIRRKIDCANQPEPGSKHTLATRRHKPLPESKPI
jgi:hypothetical protein